MAGRKRLPIGTFGEITVQKVAVRKYRASTRYRDWDGVTRQVSWTAESRAAAAWALKKELTGRMRLGDGADGLSADSPSLMGRLLAGYTSSGCSSQLVNAAVDAHAEAPTFGYRLIADELADLGFEASERRVWRLCQANGIASTTVRRRRGKSVRQGPPVHDDLVRRQFTATAPDRLWLTDITEHRTGEGKLYLCAVKDVFSNRIVGYSIDERMGADLAVNALRMAVQRRRPAGTTVHSDRGSQFRSRRFVLALHQAGLIGSMGRVGAAGDNAAMESFFALLQKNVLNTRSWQTRLELRLAIVTWIEASYHRRRRQRALGRLTPVEYEMIMTTQAAAAA